MRKWIVAAGMAVCAAGVWGQVSKLIPPELPLVSNLHCQVDPTEEGWQAKAIVSYVNPERHHDGTPWVVLIEEFKSKNRKKARQKAENACNEWLDAVNKVRAEIQPVDVKQMRKDKR